MKTLQYTMLILFLVRGVDSYSQDRRNVTQTLVFDFKAGELSFTDRYPINKRKVGKDSIYKMPGLKEGQAVALKVININPLKYYCELNGVAKTISDPPPALTAPPIGTFASLDAPGLTAPPPASPATVPPGAKIVGEAVPDSNCTTVANNIKKQIDVMLGAYKKITEIQQKVKSHSIVFNTFEDYVKQAAASNALTRDEFVDQLNAIVTRELSKPNTLVAGTDINISNAANIQVKNMETYRDKVMEEYKKQEKLFNETYADVYDAVLTKKADARCLINKYYTGSGDHTLELILIGLPETKKEILKIQEWMRTGYSTLNEKLWPSILLSTASFQNMLQLEFELPPGVYTMQKDLLLLSLTIKSKTDKTVVSQLDNIMVHRVGGIQIDYGVGLYLTGLGDDEYTTSNKERIVMKPFIKESQNLDSAYQTVSYSTLRRSSRIKVNWGAMAYIQGKSNWDNRLNLNTGIYLGLGLLANNESKPIISAGGSLIIGRLQQLSVHIGVAFGRVQRLNPSYETGKEYEGQIADPTVSIMEKSFLGGLCWKIGSIK